jgi:hypothetical protein
LDTRTNRNHNDWLTFFYEHEHRSQPYKHNDNNIKRHYND